MPPEEFVVVLFPLKKLDAATIYLVGACIAVEGPRCTWDVRRDDWVSHEQILRSREEIPTPAYRERGLQCQHKVISARFKRDSSLKLSWRLLGDNHQDADAGAARIEHVIFTVDVLDIDVVVVVPVAGPRV